MNTEYSLDQLCAAFGLSQKRRRRFRPVRLMDSPHNLPVAPNRVRLHSTLGFQSPVNFENQSNLNIPVSSAPQ